VVVVVVVVAAAAIVTVECEGTELKQDAKSALKLI
jgi:hypothetical protein